jgi:translocator protein
VSEIASRQQLRMAFIRWAVVTVPLILLLGFASARIVPAGADNSWYQALAKPAINPPAAAYPVIWALLYVLIGLALALVINARGSTLRRPAIALFVAQMVLNLLWTPLFFGTHQISWALAILGGMFLLALGTTALFARVRTAAAVLMLPYLAWIAFAGYLTYEIDRLNPHAATLVPSAVSSQIIN